MWSDIYPDTYSDIHSNIEYTKTYKLIIFIYIFKENIYSTYMVYIYMGMYIVNVCVYIYSV